MNAGKERPVLLFDGVCNLCNRAVQFVIKHDEKKQFLFASLQSEAAKALLAEASGKMKHFPDSMVLVYKGRYYVKSAAALRCAWLIGGAWQILAAGLIVPAFIRNIVYDWVAKNRYKWFGKKDECMLPTPELKDRFLL